ncbi:MAG: hypothetical protein ACM3WV_00085 [Bacillota bacterium]
MKETFSGLLAAFMLCAGGITAYAAIDAESEYKPEMLFEYFGTSYEATMYGGTLSLPMGGNFSLVVTGNRGTVNITDINEMNYLFGRGSIKMINDPQLNFSFLIGYVYSRYENFTVPDNCLYRGAGIGGYLMINPSNTSFSISASLFSTLYSNCIINGSELTPKEITLADLKISYTLDFMTLSAGYSTQEMVLASGRFFTYGYGLSMNLKLF